MILADSSIRKTSSGSVAAGEPSSLLVLICFATSLDLTCMCCLSPLLRSTRFTVMCGFLVFSNHSSRGLFSYTLIFLYHSISRARAFFTVSGLIFLTVNIKPCHCPSIGTPIDIVAFLSSLSSALPRYYLPLVLNASWMSLLVNSSSLKQLTIVLSCLFASSQSPSPSGFLFVPRHRCGPCLDLGGRLDSSSSASFIGPSSLSISTSFVSYSFSARRSFLCSSFFSPSRPSSLYSIVALFFLLHSLL